VSGKRKAPPAETGDEPKYLQELIARRARVLVRTTADDEHEGIIEYYDHSFVRLTREQDGKANLFLFKHDLKYIHEI
jgi:hypothetical protein